jgi:hypothetical protein
MTGIVENRSYLESALFQESSVGFKFTLAEVP